MDISSNSKHWNILHNICFSFFVFFFFFNDGPLWTHSILLHSWFFWIDTYFNLTSTKILTPVNFIITSLHLLPTSHIKSSFYPMKYFKEEFSTDLVLCWIKLKSIWKQEIKFWHYCSRHILNWTKIALSSSTRLGYERWYNRSRTRRDKLQQCTYTGLPLLCGNSRDVPRISQFETPPERYSKGCFLAFNHEY